MEMPRLQKKYNQEIIKQFMQEHNVNTPMAVPYIQKIVINMGLGEGRENKKILDTALKELGTITGQRGVLTTARKSISNFKLREGMKVGCKVTLRRARMYEFLDRLINVALPRVRDFRGTNPKSFDGRGNYTIGIKEQLIFPEIDYDKVEKVLGMDICIVTSAKNDEDARRLLNYLGMPFRKKQQQQ